MPRRDIDSFQDFLREVPWRLVRNGVIGAAVLVLGVACVATMMYEVEADEVGVVRRFGAYVAPPRTPGLHWKLPFFIDRVDLVKVDRVQTLSFGFRTVGSDPDGRTRYTSVREESLMLTGDQNVVDVEWVVQYKINDPKAWLFNIKKPEATIRDVSEATMRLVVGDASATEVLTERRRGISEEARTRLQETLDHYDSGIYIQNVELQNVVAPTEAVEDAFNEVNRAQQEKQRRILEANREYQKAIPEAEGEASRVVQEAEGYKLKRVNEAQGDVALFASLLDEYQRTKAVTRARLYLEAMEDVLPNLTHVYVLDDRHEGPLKVLDLKEAAGARRRQPAAETTASRESRAGGRN